MKGKGVQRREPSYPCSEPWKFIGAPISVPQSREPFPWQNQRAWVTAPIEDWSWEGLPGAAASEDDAVVTADPKRMAIERVTFPQAEMEAVGRAWAQRWNPPGMEEEQRRTSHLRAVILHKPFRATEAFLQRRSCKEPQSTRQVRLKLLWLQ